MSACDPLELRQLILSKTGKFVIDIQARKSTRRVIYYLHREFIRIDQGHGYESNSSCAADQTGVRMQEWQINLTYKFLK